TITKWLKKAGETVERDEPLFEISTDKVDAEIPSPAAGTLTEIKIAEGATVQINTVVATISDGAGGSPATDDEATPPQASAPAGGSGGGTEIPMPQMGESITEGTITKWLKQVGEK